uniref:Lectin, mannose binding 2 like n=1 Tax=Ursus maritimus TaxID=29073 RepID=A0A452U5N2_URSMA
MMVMDITGLGVLEDTQISLVPLYLHPRPVTVFLFFPFSFLQREKSVEDGGEEGTKQDHILDPLVQGRKEAGAQVEPLEPCFLRDWELQVHFKIHGQGKKNLHGDGLAIWYTKDRMQPGPVFGNMDKFVGLGVFVDTYPNEEKQQERVFPYISAMVNNGSLSYDHERDGRPTELGGCTAIVRNLHYDTFLVIRYVKRHLTIMMDIDGKHEWRDCIEVPGVRLPRGYYFGTSSITGDLSDNHDVISLKLFELTVERTPEEEKLHRDVFLPSVDNMKLPEVTAPLPPLSGLALFLIVFFSLVFSVFAIVIGIILYNKWQEQSRKRFY